MITKEEVGKEIELFFDSSTERWNKTDVNIFNLDYNQLIEYQGDTIYSRSLLFILVLSGSATIEINFKKYQIEFNNILLLSQGHFFKAHKYSKDFKCIIFYIGKEYIDEMYSSEMLYRRTKYNVKMYNIPLVYLSAIESNILKERLGLINNEIRKIHHTHQKELILLTIRMFFLDLSNIIEQRKINESREDKLSRDEIFFQKFLDLLVNNYQKEHLVDFYAQSLSITPHYLTVIIKRLTGQTVSDLIFQLIFNDAKLLLENPDISIKQIAEQLNFSDQSAFGKFFKRKSGLSPKKYRLNRIS